MKEFNGLKCLIIEDKVDHIESARNALMELGLPRENIYPDEAEQQEFSSLLEGHSEKTFQTLQATIKETNIDFILLDMSWNDGEEPPNTSGEQFISFLEGQGLIGHPIIGYSKFDKERLLKSTIPFFYIKKEGIDVSVDTIIDEFNRDIRKDALIRICSSNDTILDLSDSLEEQKVILNTFVVHLHSSNAKSVKDELIKHDLYNQINEEMKKEIESLIKYTQDKNKNIGRIKNIIFKILAHEESSKVLVTIIRSILGVEA